MNIVLSPRATRDPRAIAAHIRKESPPAAQAVLTTIAASIDALREHPRLGRKTAEAAGRRIEAALEAGEGLDASLILLALHSAILHPGVREAYRLESE